MTNRYYIKPTAKRHYFLANIQAGETLMTTSCHHKMTKVVSINIGIECSYINAFRLPERFVRILTVIVFFCEFLCGIFAVCCYFR
ncbi:MAG: hypothetical protein IJ187_06650 [Neisseriaceae bacterium]|nr:hypothetical protein [Neisseriaceae bacterium]